MRSLPIVAVGLLTFASPVLAADQKAIDAAVKKGADYLEEQFRDVKGVRNGDEGIGPAALAGLALLESGKAKDNATVKAILAAVRDAAYSENRTYQLSLHLLFLDRYGDPSDGPRIQLLAVRLLAGQDANGGWTYNCVDEIPNAEERRLRAKLDQNLLVADGKGPDPMPPAKDAKVPKDHKAAPAVEGRLHPEVERHRQGLLANQRNRAVLHDDNSNTQFAILAVWVARKHGVNVEHAMEAIEKRFLLSQTPSGGWPYSGLLGGDGSPSMTCAGLLGVATAVGRREERRLHASELPKKTEPPKEAKPEAKKEPEPNDPNDPFFTLPPKPVPMPEVKKPDAKRPAVKKPVGDPRDRAIEKGLDNLAAVLAGDIVGKGGNAFRAGGRFGDRDMYFLWSLERVGVVYGLEKIGRHNWYQLGADMLIPTQQENGAWPGGYAGDADTSFALLFLAKSNLVRDLSAKVQRDPLNAELRGGPAAREPVAVAPAAPPMPRDPQPKIDPAPVLPKPMVKSPSPIVESVKPKPAPLPAGDEAAKLAATLLKVPAGIWTQALEQVRDGKGADFTKALVYAIQQTDGDRKKQVREALAERLTRMSPETLRGMLKSEEVELRRAAALACAMKDDKTHAADLIERLTADDEEVVIRAARAGLKSLSGGQDFGPETGSSKTDRALAAEEWKAWWAKQKK